MALRCDIAHIRIEQQEKRGLLEKEKALHFLNAACGYVPATWTVACRQCLIPNAISF